MCVGFRQVDQVKAGLQLFGLFALNLSAHLHQSHVGSLAELPGLLSRGFIRAHDDVSAVFKFRIAHLVIELVWVPELGLFLKFSCSPQSLG